MKCATKDLSDLHWNWGRVQTMMKWGSMVNAEYLFQHAWLSPGSKMKVATVGYAVERVFFLLTCENLEHVHCSLEGVRGEMKTQEIKNDSYVESQP